ncbi:hypothetical protein Fcan01_08860 [Folsomia candida]|uniref:Uncharacterized protein n=1 Tax=Folsomia candida TaxID=158441 RepID=A0A226EEM5_FOLCA|nr:hypothetical protein Fcan01_08860 [Folsomia candida]
MKKEKYQTLFISYTIFTAANVVKGNDGCLIENLVDINSNCDLQFVDDGNKFEINLYHCHKEKDLLLPTTIITNYRAPSNFPGLNIHNGRIAKCKLVLMFLIHLQIVYTKFQGIAAKSEWLSEYFLASGNTKWTRLKKLFLLFIANGAVQTIGSYSPEVVVLHYFSVQLRFGSLDYIGIAHFAIRNLIQLCIYPFGLGFEHQHSPEETICMKTASNVEKLISIASPPKFWLVFNSVYRVVYLPNVPRNPFIPTANYSYITYLYSAVFERINGTKIPADKEHVKHIDMKRTAYIYHEVPMRFGSDGYSETLVVTKYSAIEFLSCYTEKFITFQFYITPFQPELWWAVGIGIVLLCIILSIYLYFAKLYRFPVWLLLLATMFEEGFPVPPSVEKNAFCRMILGTWCLMSVILTNCYNGIMTSELNAPLQGRHPITFHDLVCSKIKRSNQNLDYVLSIGGNISVLNTSIHAEYHSQIRQLLWNRPSNISMFDPLKSFDCFKLLSKVVNVSLDQRQIPQFLDLLYDIHASLLDPDYRGVRKTLSEHFISPVFTLMFNLLNPMHTHIPASVNYSTYTVQSVRKLVENEITSCGKAVFAGTSESVHSELVFLQKNYPWTNFYKGEPIFASPFALLFTNEGISKVPTYFKFMLESGIYHRLEMEQLNNEYVGRKAIVKRNNYQHGAMPVSMAGSLLTAFILCGCSITLATIYFVVECRLKLLMYLKRWIILEYFKIKHLISYKK